MKQKYLLNIADIELSVISDASPEEVERIRGILDRRMREIYLVSRCPKTEAAMLVAMGFCADRLSLQERNDELTQQKGKDDLAAEQLRARVRELNGKLEKEQSENAVLRSLLTQGNASPLPIPPSEFLEKVAEAQNRTEDEAPAPEAPQAEDAPEADSRSRIGSMFDLLSFGDAE